MQSCLVYTDTLPAWPTSLERKMSPIANLRFGPRYSRGDLAAIERANRILRRNSAIKNSFITGMPAETLFRNHADFTAFTATSEGSLLAGTNQQPWFPAGFFDQVPFRSVSILARGVLSSTSGSNTLILQSRFGTTAGSAFLSGTSVAQTAAISLTASQTNAYWEMRLDLTCNVSGIGSGNSTLSGSGFVFCPAFATPFYYGMAPSSASPQTWTSTFDDSVAQYFNLSGTFNNSSNSITCKYLAGFGWN